MSKGQSFDRVLRGYAEKEADDVKRGNLLHAAEYIKELESLERQYCQRLGEMARLSDTVCTWVLEHVNLDEDAPEVKAAAEEIMEYVEAVRP